VHDELLFEVPESEVDWVRRDVPRLLAEVGVGLNWDKAH
jgi:DNA polymerase-1